MRNGLLIGLAAGLTSAVVFASAGRAPLPIAAMLFALSSLPFYFAGLGWGWPAAAVGGVAALTAMVLATGQVTGGLLYVAAEAAPAVVLTYLATLNRPAPQGPAGSVEWYPVGRLVIASALISALLALLTMAMLPDGREVVIPMLKKYAAEALKGQTPGGQPVDATILDEIARVLYALLPFVSAASWLGSILLNLWAAARISAASGRMQRPWPDLPSTSYPPVTPLLLAAALAAWMLPDPIGRVGAAFSGAMLFAYVLAGLAIIHFVTRGQPWRPFVLWALYLSLVVLNTAASVLIAILGLAESFTRFRREPPPPGSGGSDQPPP